MERLSVRATSELISPKLRSQVSELYSGRSLVGSMPPKPATLRGRLGAFLVRGVRRTLFWFFPQLDRFHASLIEAVEFHAVAIEETAALAERIEAEFHNSFASERKALDQFLNRIGTLENAVRSLRADVDRVVQNDDEKQLARAQAEVWLETVMWRAKLEGISEELADIRNARARDLAEPAKQSRDRSLTSAANG